MVNGDATNKAPFPLILPLISMVGAGLVAYFTSEISTASTLARLDGSIIAVSNRVAVIERWVERTEGNRFTNLDGQRLERYVQTEISQHEKLPAHSDIAPRLTRIETRLDAIQKEIEVLKGGRP